MLLSEMMAPQSLTLGVVTEAASDLLPDCEAHGREDFDGHSGECQGEWTSLQSYCSLVFWHLCAVLGGLLGLGLLQAKACSHRSCHGRVDVSGERQDHASELRRDHAHDGLLKGRELDSQRLVSLLQG